MPRQPLYDRQHALDQAVQLFWEQGFHATSIKDVERALDMRPGSIYGAFGNKVRLFQAALDRYAEQGLAELDAQLQAHASPLAGLAAYLRSLGGLRDRQMPCRACMLVKSLLELNERDDATRRQADQLLAAMESRFVACFEAARTAGELSAAHDPRRLGRRLQAQVMGMRAYAQRDVDAAALHQLAEDMAGSVETLRDPSADS
ncbi:TetR/AcrR family transcriptional regulator [Salinisphaera sp.]|uniref:TetR/AcrR family transcriptional regulator n=1 Tax=Salinisphaera sp. TaxID=1914330 RepID=UPI000C3F30C5|nr:TetR family transcriptional regulator [Salinisphaera sp.]MAS09622.1 TetR family transcriptional regulator [Salinisphaera sp.]